jgi:HEAT repeat protein
MKNRLVLICITLFLLAVYSSYSQSVRSVPDSIKSLDGKWEWALKDSGNKSFYIGYAIQRLMGENSHIGCWNTSHREKKTLYEIITGKKLETAFSWYKEKSISEAAKDALSRAQGLNKKPEKKVLKEVALIFEFEPGYKDKYDFIGIKVNNMDHHVDLDDIPVYWLGKAGDPESVNLLKGVFYKRDSEPIRKKMVMAVALHDNSNEVFPFLKKVLTGKYPDSIRKSATFWIGEHEHTESVKVLIQTAEKDQSSAVRKAAVFGLYRINLTAADDALIKIAKQGRDYDSRKQAIFWLGQKAIKRSAEVLKSVVDDDSDVSIQNQAVFALSQLSNGKGIPHLVKIAKTHKNMKIRKKAIFWLGQSGDERALATIIDILKSGPK